MRSRFAVLPRRPGCSISIADAVRLVSLAFDFAGSARPRIHEGAHSHLTPLSDDLQQGGADHERMRPDFTGIEGSRYDCRTVGREVT